VYSSSNDAFSNQHSLIPPSFGGPQLQVTLPRIPNIATSASLTTASHDSQSTTQTVVSSDFDVAETGHDVVKELFSDGVNYQQPDELMSAAERTSISAAGAGFDAALRRASAPEAGEMCSEEHGIDMTYVDTSVTVESSDSLRNGHTTWHLLNSGLGRVASDSSIASSVGSILEGNSMDISGLVCRTAAVAGHSSFKTHALTERSLDVSDIGCSIDDSSVSLTDKTVTAVAGHSSFKTHALTERSLDVSDIGCSVDDSSVSLTDKTESHDDGNSSAAEQPNVNECNDTAHSDNAMQENCLK